MEIIEQYKSLNPLNLSKNIDVNELVESDLKKIYEKMKLIREAEYKIAIGRESGLIKGPVHLGIGQEAIAVGVSFNLNKDDFIFGAHRSHSHIISQGTSIKKLFAEILGKSTGLSKGFGGSMHLIDKSIGFMGSVPIVGGSISLAVGAGLAISIKGTNNISVSYLGDGAAEEGCFHESLNLAKINNLPVVFVVENNLFSSHMDISLRQPNPYISRFAEANQIPYKLLDGNNVIEVLKSSKQLINNCRSGKGPVLIEAITYRWFGHVDWREDIDVGILRSKEDLHNWKEKCPLKRLKESIIETKILSEQYFIEIDKKVKREIDEHWEKALKDKYPNKEDLLKYVYNE